ncbi:MAG TPA: hypothetical protein VF556_03665 [Pyrinomonadaceae bacterium]|jgi:hypothetical protein
MSSYKRVFSAYFVVILLISGFTVQTNAQRRNEREVRDIIRSLRSKIDDFQYNLTYQLRSNSADRDEVIEIETNLRGLNDRINSFETNLDRRRENRDDVSRILDAARNIDNYLNLNPQNRRIENEWTNVRSLLDRLAAAYNITGNRSGGNSDYPNNNRSTNNYPQTTSGNVSNGFGLTGTYRLDALRSENTGDIIADSNIANGSQRRDLEEKLQSPEQIAIDVRGNQVILASSNASPISFVADGTTRNETANGRTIRVRAALRGQELTVSSLGGETDYTVTFTSIDGGRSLKVTRRITTDYLNQTVFADSIYQKSDNIARLGINGTQNTNQTTSQRGDASADDEAYSSSDQNDRYGSNNYPNNNYPTTSTVRRGDYIVPNGTIITGILENEINTKASQSGDRFRMTVQAPNQFRGATIEGYISGMTRSGQVSGRSQVTFNFERITLRNGQTYDFAGFLQSVTDQNGKSVRVDAEGAAKGDNQTTETVKRGGIGAGLGAIIGAIAGGGKGAAIGAIIGGSAGAGSVLVLGKEELELKQGSTITVQASSPLR